MKRGLRIGLPLAMLEDSKGSMMTEIFPVFLPLLRGPLPSQAFEASAQPDLASAPQKGAAPCWSGVARLWPGLPDAPSGFFCTQEYPFSPGEAQACLNDLQQLGDAALSGMQVGAAAAGNARAASHSSEMALIKGLRSFDGDTAAALAAEAARKDLLARRQAQKMLLWAWLQEDRLADLAELAASFAQNASGLTAALGVDPDEDLAGLAPDALTGDLVRLGSPIALDAGLVPPWRLVTANALYFLPAETPLVVEGPMRDDLLDMLPFSPAPHWQSLLGDAPDQGAPSDVAVEIRAPGWQVLGHTRPTGQPPVDVERVWITWRAGA